MRLERVGFTAVASAASFNTGLTASAMLSQRSDSLSDRSRTV
jgi:hypothetical protein